MKIDDIEIVYRRKHTEMCATYYGELMKVLSDLKLDKRVIRVRDGVEGVLTLYKQNYWEELFEWKLSFYPVTKNGEISKKASGYVASWQNLEEQFKPKEEEE